MTYKTLFFLITLIFYCNSDILQAQSTQFGIKGGLNISNFIVNEEVAARNIKGGVHGGVFVKIPVTDFFAVQPEVLFTSKGAKYEVGTIDGEVRLNYLEVPVLAVINIGPFNVHAGPYWSYLINTKYRYEQADNAIVVEDSQKSFFKDFEFGLAAGLGIEIDRVHVGARYNFGLSKIEEPFQVGMVNVDNIDLKNSVLQLYAGFSF